MFSLQFYIRTSALSYNDTKSSYPMLDIGVGASAANTLYDRVAALAPVGAHEDDDTSSRSTMECGVGPWQWQQVAWQQVAWQGHGSGNGRGNRRAIWTVTTLLSLITMSNRAQKPWILWQATPPITLHQLPVIHVAQQARYRSSMGLSYGHKFDTTDTGDGNKYEWEHIQKNIQNRKHGSDNEQEGNKKGTFSDTEWSQTLTLCSSPPCPLLFTPPPPYLPSCHLSSLHAYASCPLPLTFCPLPPHACAWPSLPLGVWGKPLGDKLFYVFLLCDCLNLSLEHLVPAMVESGCWTKWTINMVQWGNSFVLKKEVLLCLRSLDWEI